jgi:hypothetical protein
MDHAPLNERLPHVHRRLIQADTPLSRDHVASVRNQGMGMTTGNHPMGPLRLVLGHNCL